MISLFKQGRKRQKNQFLITQEKGHSTTAGKVQDILNEFLKKAKCQAQS